MASVHKTLLVGSLFIEGVWTVHSKCRAGWKPNNWNYTFIDVFRTRRWSFYKHKNFKLNQILLTGPISRRLSMFLKSKMISPEIPHLRVYSQHHVTATVSRLVLIGWGIPLHHLCNSGTMSSDATTLPTTFRPLALGEHWNEWAAIVLARLTHTKLSGKEGEINS